MNALFFGLIALGWGGVWLPIKIAVSVFPPFTTAALRLLLTALAAAVAKQWMQSPKASGQTWRYGLLLGVIGLGVPWILLFWGQQYIYPGVSSIINSTVPLFTVVYSWLIFRDQSETGKRKLVGVICGFIGVLVIFSPQLRELLARNSATSAYETWGMLAVLGMAACYGLHIVLVKRFSLKVDVNTSLLMQTIGGLGLLAMVALIFEFRRFPSPQTPHFNAAVSSIIYMSLIGSFASLNLFFRLIQRVGAVKAGTVTYLIPIITILIDWIYYHLWPQPNQLWGALLIFLGLGIIHLIPSSRKPTTNNKVMSATA